LQQNTEGDKTSNKIFKKVFSKLERNLCPIPCDGHPFLFVAKMSYQCHMGEDLNKRYKDRYREEKAVSCGRRQLEADSSVFFTESKIQVFYLMTACQFIGFEYENQQRVWSVQQQQGSMLRPKS
jgi:hypothetical protein